MTDKDRAEQILNKLNAEYPTADTMLHYGNLYELLVAVVLSAQSTDEQVNRVTPALFERFPDLQSLADAELSELEGYIRGVGIFRTKARNIKKLARMIMDEYNGVIPDQFEELLKLPGVGRKTANVVIAVGFKGPGLGVDTHVHRVANRLGLAATKDRSRTELRLKELIPEEQWNKSHHLLIWHGRQICKARKPQCEKCVLNQLCPAYSHVPSDDDKIS